LARVSLTSKWLQEGAGHWHWRRTVVDEVREALRKWRLQTNVARGRLMLGKAGRTSPFSRFEVNAGREKKGERSKCQEQGLVSAKGRI
jgi:hypothetical protein